jgi:hypothetical protein
VSNVQLLKFISPFNDSTKDSLKKKLKNVIGYSGNFEDDTWIFENHANYTVSNSGNYRIYFGQVPVEFKDIMKYYTLRNVQSISSMQQNIAKLTGFFNFILECYDFIDLKRVSFNVLKDYKSYIMVKQNVNAKTISGYWTRLQRFFEVMHDFEEIPNVVFPEGINIKSLEHSKSSLMDESDNEYVSKEFFYELDRVFYDFKETLPTHVQLVYWLLRLIPSRINEILDMNVYECLRKFDDKFIISMPIPKTSPNVIIKKKMVYINGKSDVENFLIDLVYKQKNVSDQLQWEIKKQKKTEGLLFTCFGIDGKNSDLNKTSYRNTIVDRYEDAYFNNRLKLIIYQADKLVDEYGEKIYKLRNENNELYNITSHSLRHEGITDRLDYGFQTYEIMFLAGLSEEETIWNSYYHPREESIVESKPIYNTNNIHEHILIKPSDIMVNDAFDGLDISIDFQGNASVDELLLDFQREYDQQTPLITNDGAYLGNCVNFYNCSKIKRDLNCLGCPYSKKDIINGGLESIQKAIDTYTHDIEFYKLNGNVKMAEIAASMLKRYTERKQQNLMGGEIYGC